MTPVMELNYSFLFFSMNFNGCQITKKLPKNSLQRTFGIKSKTFFSLSFSLAFGCKNSLPNILFHHQIAATKLGVVFWKKLTFAFCGDLRQFWSIYNDKNITVVFGQADTSLSGQNGQNLRIFSENPDKTGFFRNI